jgi:hypothetical protein
MFFSFLKLYDVKIRRLSTDKQNLQNEVYANIHAIFVKFPYIDYMYCFLLIDNRYNKLTS